MFKCQVEEMEIQVQIYLIINSILFTIINLEFKFIYTRSNETRKRVGIKMITAFPPPQKKNTGHRNIRCMATMPNT